MAKFLNTKKAVSEIEDLIKHAGDKLILVSPFLKLSKDFRELLKYRDNKGLQTTIIYGKGEVIPEERKFLQSLRFLKLKYYQDLHAKCYLNEEKIIITSLNLYDFSMMNNKEMGVLIDIHDPADGKLFKDAFMEVQYISDLAKEETNPDNNKTKNTSATKNKTVQSDKLHFGYCIRTGVPIQFNPERPLSYEAYQVWSQFSDPDYAEKYCHFSGEPSNGETSVNYPILKKNWKRAKEVFGL